MRMREESDNIKQQPLKGFAVSQPCLSSLNLAESLLQVIAPQSQELKAFHRLLMEISFESSNILKRTAAQCTSLELRTVTI